MTKGVKHFLKINARLWLPALVVGALAGVSACIE